MFPIILALHLLGFIIIAGLVIASIVTVVRSQYDRMSFMAKSLAIASVVQLCSGSLLLLVQEPSRSLGTFCVRIGAYLAVIIAVEVLLYWKINQGNRQRFPLTTVTSLMAAGIIMTVVTLFTYF